MTSINTHAHYLAKFVTTFLVKVVPQVYWLLLVPNRSGEGSKVRVKTWYTSADLYHRLSRLSVQMAVGRCEGVG